VHAPSQEKSGDSKESFYDEFARIFENFPRYNMKIIFVDFNAKVGKEYIFKPTTGNEGLHQDSNDNVVRIVNRAYQKM
jgi:hypothetical protein